jgi:hypothetical protein
MKATTNFDPQAAAKTLMQGAHSNTLAAAEQTSLHA